mgnify:CR=1 FL=1
MSLKKRVKIFSHCIFYPFPKQPIWRIFCWSNFKTHGDGKTYNSNGGKRPSEIEHVTSA